MRVLVTRPEREGRATLAKLAALGHDGVLEPLTIIVPAADLHLPDAPLQAVTATSLNAVDTLAGRPEVDALRALPFFAVGDRTARAARDAGFTDVRSAAGDRRALARLLTATLDPAKGAVLWLVGHDRAGDLVADLAPTGFRVLTLEVYRAEPVAALSGEARAEITAGRIDAALVFSPRSAAILLEKLTDAGFRPASLPFSVHAISEATARPFRSVGWPRIAVATSPDTDAMLATLGTLPPGSEPVGDDSRSSIMTPKPELDGHKEPETAAEGAAPIEPTAVESPAAEESPAAPESSEPIVDSETPAPAVDADAAPGTEPVDAAVADVEPETPAPAAPVAAPVAAPPQKSSGVGLALVATLLGGVVGIGGAYGLAWKGLLPGANDTRVAALEATVAALKAPATPTVDPATTARLAALEKRLAETPAPAPVDLSALDARLAKLESVGSAAPAATAPATDLAGLDARLAKLEASALPADLAERLAGLEAAAKARLEAAQSSVAGALSALPGDGSTKEALAQVAGRVDAAVGSLRESAGAQIAELKAHLDRLGGGFDAEGKALAQRLGTLADATAAEFQKRNAEIAKLLDERVAALTGATEAELQKRQEEMAKALDGLRQRLQAVEGLRADVDAALGRVGTLETTTREVGSTGQKLSETVDEAAAATQGKVGALESRLTGIEAGAEAARKAQADAVLAVALAELKSAVDAGRPFAPEFGVVEAAARGSLDLATLKPFVATGVPSVTALRERWPKVLRTLLEAEEKKTSGDGVFDRLLSHAGAMVKIRPSGEKAGDDVAALASRVEARLRAGDLPATLAAWKALPADAQRASADWGGALAARVDVDRALTAQTASVVSKLTRQSQ